MSINKEIWIATIEENLYPDSEFINYSQDHSAFVNNAVVHVPNAGAKFNVQQNRSSFPGTVTQRTDSDLTYNLNEYSTDPIFLQYSEELEINYDKRSSILMNMVEDLKEVIGNQTAYAWSPSNSVSGVTRIVRTSGSLSATSLSSGATGSRQQITLADIANAKSIVLNDNFRDDGSNMFMLMPVNMYYNELLQISEVAELFKAGFATLPTGAINRIYNLNIMTRPTVSVYNTGATPTLKTVDAYGRPLTTNTTDNLAVLVWHRNAVSTAKGETKVYFEAGRPEYYGDLFSAVIRHGAAKLRADGKGIAAIVQQ